MTRPNILLVMCDQMRADHTGFGGSEVIETPNLDRLAARGRVFDRAHVANPICMPNRASIATGRAPSAHGLASNTGALAWSSNTFVRALRTAGYRTTLVGKADLQNGLRRAMDAEPTGAAPVGDPYAPGWDRWEDPPRFEAEPFSDPDDFYGFEHLALTVGHADMVAGHHLRWALAQGADRDQLAQAGPAHALAVDDHWWQVYKPRLPEELSSTTFVTEATIAAIDAGAHDDRPWFVQCSFPDPHHPFAPSGRWYDRHRPDDMPLPETFADDIDRAPDHYRAFRSLRPSRMPVQMFGPTPLELRAATAAEAGSIEAIDDGIGRILAAIATHGTADNTVVVFTSDHGDMFGDHGLMLKGVMHYEGCTRVPLVIAGPGVGEPGRTRALASSLDLAPTILGLADAPGYEGIQGHDLSDVLDDATATVRTSLYVEEELPMAALFPFPVPTHARTIITRDARLTVFGATGEGELYDHTEDPLERNNRWADAAADQRRADLTAELLVQAMVHASPPRLGTLVG